MSARAVRAECGSKMKAKYLITAISVISTLILSGCGGGDCVGVHGCVVVVILVVRVVVVLVENELLLVQVRMVAVAVLPRWLRPLLVIAVARM